MTQTRRANATFTVDEVTAGERLGDRDGTELARARVRKTFSGALEGTGEVEMTTAVAAGGRGYVGIEWIEGVLDGRTGGFALLHCGTMGVDGQWATWPIVPGSGSAELAGISGNATIEIDAAGGHHFALDYAIDPA